MWELHNKCDCMHISEGCTLHNVFIVLVLLPTIEWGTSTVFTAIIKLCQEAGYETIITIPFLMRTVLKNWLNKRPWSFFKILVCMHNLYLYKEFMHIYLFIWPVVIISKCIREYLDNINKIPTYPCISYTHFRLASFIQTLVPAYH